MKTVIITGGTRGIGKVITLHFLDAGYNVMVCSKSETSVRQARQLFKTQESRLQIQQADISKEDDVRRLIDNALTTFKSVDVLINNAGIVGPIGRCHENDTTAWFETFHTNIFGPFLTCKCCIPHMLKAGFGRIINLSGGGATTPTLRYSAYSASKAALIRFTETMALELQGTNVTANAIAPGFICTDIHQETWSAGSDAAGGFYEKSKQKWASGGDDPKRAAELALYLASEECRITGKLISAIYDPWETFRDGPSIDNDLYTLRRIDSMFFGPIQRL